MTKEERQRAVNNAIASCRLEGLTVSRRMRILAKQYVNGKITAAEMRAKAVAMYVSTG